MIVTVTMNPAIDKTVEISRLNSGGLNRIQNVQYDAGGKGINVSKTIHELGGSSVATGFLAGNTGKTIENVLKEKGIETDFIWTDGETRTNTKVLEESGEVTELNEPGPDITKEQEKALFLKLERYADENVLFVLAGSIPNGLKVDIYEKMIRFLHAKGAKVLLDADGCMFRQALLAEPDIIKPNRAELEEYMGIDYRASDRDLVSVSRKLRENGIHTIAVSMGKGGAIFIRDEYEVRCPALSVKSHSTVGAGDAMVGALAYAWDQKLSNDETVRICIGASAGAVTTIGTKPPARTLVNELMEQVKIERIGE